MRLINLSIENFRRIGSTEVEFAPASFIIGPNNYGKSSIVAAIEALLSLDKERISPADFREKPGSIREDTIKLTGRFGSIAPEVAASRGFRGRVINGVFTYRKTFSITGKPIIETLEFPSQIRPEFKSAKTVGEIIDAGIDAGTIKSALKLENRAEKLPKEWGTAVPEALVFDEKAEPSWVKNPGGIPSNVVSRLPRVLHVKSFTDVNELQSSDKKYVLGECLSILFEDIVAQTPLADEIQERLTALQNQMDPQNEASLIRKLCEDVNVIIGDVFPGCGVEVLPSLQGVVDILRPKYEISIFSNVKTGADRQGTGLVRTAAFAMLRYHAKMKIEKELQTRPILAAFEEPELYLHPAAANLLRDTIYDLGRSDQIVCTTHSPWMVDLSRDPQSITRMFDKGDEGLGAVNYGVSTILNRLEVPDRERVKMLLVFDDEVSRVFFSEEVVVVEGDSELITIKETLKFLDEDSRKNVLARFQVIRARGKATIISLVKYLKDLCIRPRVMHDSDVGVEGAEKFNAPIAAAVADAGRLVVLQPNLETVLGYSPPARDKPFKAYEYVSKWRSKDDIPETWRKQFGLLFGVKL